VLVVESGEGRKSWQMGVIGDGGGGWSVRQDREKIHQYITETFSLLVVISIVVIAIILVVMVVASGSVQVG
jgi:hypothetical protein